MLNKIYLIVVFIIIIVCIRIILWINFNIFHRFHSSYWLIEHSNKFISESSSSKKAKYIINQLYNAQFKYLDEAQESIFLLEDTIQFNENILGAFCGIRFEHDGSSGSRYSPILVITSKRILFIDGEFDSIQYIDPDLVKSVKFKCEIPLFRRKGLKLEFNNRYPLFLQLISKNDCRFIARIIHQRQLNVRSLN